MALAAVAAISGWLCGLSGQTMAGGAATFVVRHGVAIACALEREIVCVYVRERDREVR